MATSTAGELSPIRRLWRLLLPDRREIAYIYLYAVLVGIISLAVPLGVQAIINLVAGGEFNASLVVLAVVVSIATVFVGALRIMQLVVAETLQRRLFARASLEFAYRLPRIEISALNDYYPPELVNRFFDTINIQKGLPKILMDYSGAIMQIIFGIALVSFYNTFFGLLGLALVVLLIVVLRVISPASLRTSILESKYKYKVASWLEDIARANNTFKLAGGSNLAMERTDELVLGYLNNRRRHFRLLTGHYVSYVILQAVVTLSFLLLGGYLVINNQINIGQFVAAELVILTLISASEKIIFGFDTIYDVLTGVEKLSSVTDLPLEDNGKLEYASVDNGEGISIEAYKVNFTYERSGAQALIDINFSIESNACVCLSGYNTSGRSTLLQLMSGLRLDFTGRLLYNATPIGNFNLDSLRSMIGDLTAQESIIPGTVYENVVMGHEQVTLKDVRWALDLAGLSDWIAGQDEGYDTTLLAEGLNVPRSVRAQLLVARAIVQRPRLLIIGNVLDQLEPAMRMAIVGQLVHKTNHWTLVVSSNDPRVARMCDRVFVLRKGHLVDQGTPVEVLGNPANEGLWMSEPIVT